MTRVEDMPTGRAVGAEADGRVQLPLRAVPARCPGVLGAEHRLAQQTVVPSPFIQILPLVRFGPTGQTLFHAVIEAGYAERKELERGDCPPLVVIGGVDG